MTDEHDPQQEPKPGSTEWLLAQLSGGRIDSRRERREAEAELEARGVQFDSTTGAITLPEQSEQPGQSESESADEVQAAGEQAPDASADERPKARFSWETGTLHAVTPASDGDAPAASDEDEPDDEPFVDQAGSAAPPVSARPQQREPLWFEAPDAPPLTFDSTFTAPEPARPGPEAESGSPFRWNLLPTDDADPALDPKLELPESMRPAVPPVVPAAPPLIAPKPLSRRGDEATDASQHAPSATPEVAATSLGAHTVDEPSPDAGPAAESTPAPTPLPPAEPEERTPEAADAPENATVAGSPTLLPPGTTAREFDPFAQDLFAPEAAAGTPVPSVDEFTIPDEERGGEASAAPTQAVDMQSFLPTRAVPTSPGAPTPHDSAAADADADAAAADLAVAADEGAAGTENPDVSSTWTDITDLLGAKPETVENSIVPEWPPPEGTFDGFAQAVAPAADVIAQAVAPAAAARQAAARPDSAPVEHRRRPLNRWLIVVVAVLVVVLIAVVLFAVGRAVANGRNAARAAAAATTHAASPRPSASVSPTPVVTPSATPSATPALPPTGTLPAGQTYQWDQLRGGECINPFGGAWAQQYAVVNCNSQHAAQLVYAAPYSSNPAAPFPGEQAIASQINLLCSKPGVVDMTAAAAYSDLQLVASYPVTAAQWAGGQRSYYCFVTRSSGQMLTSSVQGPGPQ